MEWRIGSARTITMEAEAAAPPRLQGEEESTRLGRRSQGKGAAGAAAGRQCVRKGKKHQSLLEVIVIVLTTSSSPKRRLSFEKYSRL